MKYKVGDKVRIKSLDWYNENKGNADKTNSVWCGAWFFYHMSQYCGKIMTIENVWANSYKLEGSDSRWTDEMIEGLVEEHGLPCPEGYQFVDENGNVINTQKIVLEKKKKEYPKTYEECEKVLRYDSHRLDNMGVTVRGYKWELIRAFQILLICRDAYWKIAGEEMGLGKPWKPDWDAKDNHFYTIYTFNGKIECSATAHRNAVLIFPTEEMRDAFYENFKELIESCKEFL